MKMLEATEQSTELLAFFAEIEAGCETVMVTRQGKPIANVIPLPEASPQQDPDSIFGFYKGKVEVRGDIMASLYTDEEFEQFFQESAAQFK